VKQFNIELFVVHPTLDPAEIDAGIGLRAQTTHRAGDRRRSPAGALLRGTYRDTRWRYARHYETSGQGFADKIVDLIDGLEPHAEFIAQLRSTGGRACVIVQLLGDAYFADEISQDLLKRMSDLGLGLGIESFADPQSESRESRSG